MQRTSIFILATLLAVPASEALAKDKGHGKGHAKHANKAEKARDHDDDGRIVRERARDRDDGVRRADRAGRRHGLDRNGDGIITRAEWRGNDRSFDVQDRNNDGVISARDRNHTSGRSGANSRYGDWRSLDRDADGRLERWEWPHGDSLFNDIDRNNDGLVSQWELRNSVR
jgi:hypothetical protein